jgi:phospholipase/lecithinase/hemolysin
MRLSQGHRYHTILFCVVAFLLFTSATAFASANDYKNIVIFGDSLSDAGNDAHISLPTPNEFPGPAWGYTDGRFTDGNDLGYPFPLEYVGVWVEQFAATLPSHPQVLDSLDGGTDYAYGAATTANGTTVWEYYAPLSLSIQVNNIGQQITDYLKTHPKIDDHTLFIVWGGANDVLGALASGTPPQRAIINAALQQTLNIQRLVNAGATQFIVPNLPPLGLTPRLNTPDTASGATAASALYNSFLATGIQVLRDFYAFRGLKIYQLDTFTLFNQIVASPVSFGLWDVTAPSSPVWNPAAGDPDTYLFWDPIHPTTHGHNILANSASSLIAQPCSTRGAHCVFPSN